MIFHLDEHISERLTERAVARGLDVVSVDRLGLKGLDDAANLLLAARTGRVLVTYDVRDYTLLHRAWLLWSTSWVADDPPQHAGIAVVHTAKLVGNNEIVDALVSLGELVDSSINRLFSWDHREGWTELS
ncbi:MAG TPA: DUF5615 family PIN-like protein [Thermomicrobiales bacterium]|jgi:hypothetical protein